MIAGVAVGNELHHEYRDGGEYQNVHEAAFVQYELEYKPNYKQNSAKCPHTQFLRRWLDELRVRRADLLTGAITAPPEIKKRTGFMYERKPKGATRQK